VGPNRLRRKTAFRSVLALLKSFVTGWSIIKLASKIVSHVISASWLRDTLYRGRKKVYLEGVRGITFAFIGIMFLIIISSALTLTSAVTLAFMAFRAPEAYETEHGLQVLRRIPQQRSTERLAGTLAQAR
jgi:hypothetical protein